jgi:hypothetical protein
MEGVDFGWLMNGWRSLNTGLRGWRGMARSPKLFRRSLQPPRCTFRRQSLRRVRDRLLQKAELLLGDLYLIRIHRDPVWSEREPRSDTESRFVK